MVPRRVFISSVIKITGNVNADVGVGIRIPLKKILTWNQETRVFVSARCLRRCIRERLFEKGFPIDPLHLVGRKGEEQLGDIGDPVSYVDDDLFGFLSPEEVPRKRSGPVKISHLVSLRHTEVKPEFAGRFPRDFLPEFQAGFPALFEVEVAEWLGRLDVIVSDRIGCFEKSEISNKGVHSTLEEKGNLYYLPIDDRKKRLRALLEVLLWEGWQFPRAAQSPSVPEFYYSVIALTQRFTPIFGYVDVDENGNLAQNRLEQLKRLYGQLIDSLFVLNYREGWYRMYLKTGGIISGGKEEELDSGSIGRVISNILEYMFPI